MLSPDQADDLKRIADALEELCVILTKEDKS